MSDFQSCPECRTYNATGRRACTNCGGSGSIMTDTDEESAAWVARNLPELKADFARVLPSGKFDDADYGAIEDALDKADAPMTDNPLSDGGRWLTLPERIAAMAKAAEISDRTILGLNRQLTEQFELSTKYCGLWDGAHTALHNIQRYARSDGQRTFDDCIRDLERIDDLCRGALK